MSGRARLPAIAIGIVIVVAAVQSLRGAVPAVGRDGTHRPGSIEPAARMAEASTCQGTVTGSLSADTIRACESVTVTLRPKAFCHACPTGANVIFIMAPVGNPVGEWQRSNSLEALAELRAIQDATGFPVRAAVIDYDYTNATVSVPLTDNLQAVEANLKLGRDFKHWGAYLQVQKAALGVLTSAHEGEPRNSSRCDFVVYFLGTDLTVYTRIRDQVLAQVRDGARAIKRTGATLVMGCWCCYPDVCGLSRDVAGAGYYMNFFEPQRLAPILRGEIRRWIGALTVRSLSLDQRIPARLALEAASAAPPLHAMRSLTDSTEVTWLWPTLLPTETLSVRYRLRPFADVPEAAGAWPVAGTMVFTDSNGLNHHVVAQPLTVTVSGPCILPSPTASPTPTHTSTPQPTTPLTPTSTSTGRSPSPTPTEPPPAPALYLPLGLNERCDPQHKRADVALVIDTSSSMTGRKLEDAKSAAAAFVRQMDLAPGRDQVAVVRYDTEAEVVCRLTAAAAIIEGAIRNLTSRSGTHIDKGLRAALAELQGPRHLERNLPVIVLLTDGVQTGTPGEELRAAAEVRSAGVRLYTIGLGADVDAATLLQMVGDVSRYHFAPDSADLARIYAEIARDVLCPASARGFWPLMSRRDPRR